MGKSEQMLLEVLMIEWKRGESLQLSEHFMAEEFECPCECVDQKISRELLSKLEHVRYTYGKGIHVNSGYRCEKHNVAVGGVAKSAHVDGLAADIAPLHVELDLLDELYKLCYNEFDNIGNGINKGFIHVDVRPLKADGTKRTWLYT